MLGPHVATKHWFLFGVTLMVAGACSEPAPTNPDADAGLEGDPCDVCGGSHQAVSPALDGSDATCGAEWQACINDPGCAAIIACVFKPTHDASASDPGCAIAKKINNKIVPQYDGGSSAAATCVDQCIQKHCGGSVASAQKYLAAENCSYCGPSCKTVCDGYCTHLPQTATCGGPADGGAG